MANHPRRRTKSLCSTPYINGDWRIISKCLTDHQVPFSALNLINGWLHTAKLLETWRLSKWSLIYLTSRGPIPLLNVSKRFCTMSPYFFKLSFFKDSLSKLHTIVYLPNKLNWTFYLLSTRRPIFIHITWIQHHIPSLRAYSPSPLNYLTHTKHLKMAFKVVSINAQRLKLPSEKICTTKRSHQPKGWRTSTKRLVQETHFATSKSLHSHGKNITISSKPQDIGRKMLSRNLLNSTYTKLSQTPKVAIWFATSTEPPTPWSTSMAWISNNCDSTKITQDNYASPERKCYHGWGL